MIITSTEKYLTVGSISFNKERIKAITKDQDIVIIDASGREDPETAPGNYMRVDYRTITQPQVFASADLLLAFLKRKAKPVQAPAISLVSASAITEISARINATIDNKNADTVITVEYGITAAYGQTKAGGTVSELGQVAIDLTGLLVYTPYFYRVKAVNSAGTVYLAGANFTTAYPAEFDAYLTRVTADAGIVRSNEFTKSYIAFLKNQGRYNDVKVLIAPEAGSKRRVSGINTYISKLHSPQLAANDAVQTTELSQPFLAGNIASNEKYNLLIPNGSVKFVSHPSITFLPSQPFTVNFFCNLNNDESKGFLKFNSSSNGAIWIQKLAPKTYRFYSATAIGDFLGTTFTYSFVGKNNLLTFIYDGSGTYQIYINGAVVNTFSKAEVERPTFTFNQLCNNDINYYPYGRFFIYTVQSGALTPLQVASEYGYLRSWLPEISNVTINTQRWASSNLDVICTPQGNVINNAQENANVDQLLGWNFTIGWAALSGVIIDNNTFSTDTTSGGIYKLFLTAGKWYKLVFAGTVTGGNVRVYQGNTSGTRIDLTGDLGGTFNQTAYFRASSSTELTLYIRNTGLCTTDVTTLTCELIGWSGSQGIYDYIYAATAGTDEQKTYAAVKSAAMWCYYNNDPVTGSVYGKLYNWYAAKLLQMDIDYYNISNPAGPWGWRIPTDISLAALISGLGGNGIAGLKIKVTGTAYFNPPNESASNESGFTMLGAGVRLDTDGSFSSIGLDGAIWSITEVGAGAYRMRVQSSTSEAILTDVSKKRGYPIRLLKT